MADPNDPLLQGDQSGTGVTGSSVNPYIPPSPNDLPHMTLADKLAQIAGLLSTGAGTAANIIGVTRKYPIANAGAASLQSGQDLLNESIKKADLVESSQKIQQYLSDPNIDPAVKSVAMSHMLNNDPKTALSVFTDAFKESQSLKKSMALQNYGITVSLQKQKALDDQKTSEIIGKKSMLDDLILKDQTQGLTGNEKAARDTLVAVLNREGLAMNPNASPKLAPVLQKIATPFATANQVTDFSDRINTLLSKLPTGRFGGRALSLEEMITAMPDLKESALLTRMLQAKTARALMGEQGRIPVQVENQLGELLQGRKLYPSELKSVTNGLKFAAEEAKKTARSQYLALPGADTNSLKEFESRINVGGYEGSSQPQSSLEDLLKKHGATLKETP